MAIAVVGLDLAKHVFQVHAVDETGRAVLRRQLRRAGVEAFFKMLSPCIVGMEACASAHYWARRISALGHEVRLIAPAKVKPYVQHGRKNDANDAAAIVEALMRPHMVFVPIKNEAQQAVLMLHRTRDLLVRQRTMLVHAIRAHLAEFGIVAAQGRSKVQDLITGLGNTEIPELARIALWQIADLNSKYGVAAWLSRSRLADCCAMSSFRSPYASVVAAGLRRHGRSPVRAALYQQGPDDAGHLVGQGGGNQHAWLAREHSRQPRARRGATLTGPADHCAGTQDQQSPDGPLAPL